MSAGDLQRAIFKSAHFLGIATDATGVIQAFSIGCERMLGYRAVEVINRLTLADLSDLLPLTTVAGPHRVDGDAPMAPGFEALVHRAAGGAEDGVDLSFVCKDQSRLAAVVSVVAVRDSPGVIIGYLLIGAARSATKPIAQELDALEASIDVVLVTDPRGIILDLNAPALALTGRSRDELIGAAFEDCFTDTHRARAAIASVLTEGVLTNYELTMRTKDGTVAVLSCNVSAVTDRGQRLRRVLVVARDITELKRVEDDLRHRHGELDRADTLKSEFLAQMSHQLRSGLSPVIGFADVLRDGLIGPLTDPQRGFIEEIYGSGTHLLSLIDDVLDLSKVEAGEMTLNLGPVHLSPMLANSLSIVKEKAFARRIYLSVQSSGDLGPSLADKRKVQQIIYNLLSNAVKFTPDGGKVILSACRVSRADVGRRSHDWAGRRFSLPENGFEEFLEIRVTDNGIGISPQELEALFTPFSQVDNDVVRTVEGTGLGLAMIKRLAELHGGTVAVESAIGLGSSFSAWLPFRALEAAAMV